MISSLGNLMTTARLVLTLALLVTLGVFGKVNLTISLPLIGAIILTDVADGYFARKYKVRLGGELYDLFADAVYVLSTGWALMRLGLLPGWYLLLVLYKLVEFLGTSRLFLRQFRLAYDLPGRIAAAGFMILPAAVIVARLYFAHVQWLPSVSLQAVTALSFTSSVARLGRLNVKNR